MKDRSNKSKEEKKKRVTEGNKNSNYLCQRPAAPPAGTLSLSLARTLNMCAPHVCVRVCADPWRSRQVSC